jgi:hypothetical protein
MARLADEGRTRVTWCAAGSIANVSAPVAATLNAGTTLETFITPTGLGINVTDQTVSLSNLASVDDLSTVGRTTYDVSLEFQRDDATDTAYNLFVRGVAGFLVVRRILLIATAFAAAQKVEVYPLICGRERPKPPAANELASFTTGFYVNSPPDMRAIVA